MLLNCGVGEDSWESLGLQGDPICPSYRRSVLGVHWKDWCWSWNSNTLATWCKELTHLKRPWCWEGLKAEKKGMTKDEMVGCYHQLSGQEFRWTPGVGDGQGGLACCGMWSRKESDMTERLNWTELKAIKLFSWNLCLVSFGARMEYRSPISGAFAFAVTCVCGCVCVCVWMCVYVRDILRHVNFYIYKKFHAWSSPGQTMMMIPCPSWNP